MQKQFDSYFFTRNTICSLYTLSQDCVLYFDVKSHKTTFAMEYESVN